MGILLLSLLLGLGLWAARHMEALCRPMEEALLTALSAVQKEDWDTALAHADKARSAWDRSRHTLTLAADQTPMDDTDRLFVQMQVYAQSRDGAHFAACCGELAVMMQAISDAHGLHISSLF